MRYFVFIVVLIANAAFGQGVDTLQTNYLPEVQVYGMAVSKYAAGTQIETIQGNPNTLLDQALTQSPSVYFKTYGNSQLSTIAFRGTSASHTAVLWNGMNINSPTLGQTDFSLLPSYLLDEITLQYGTSSSLYGSDALGGSVLINAAAPLFNRSLLASLYQDVGSFGSLFTGGKLQWSTNRWEVRTKLMYRTLENDFPYTSPAVGTRKIQHDAAVKQYGVDQQIHFKVSDHQRIAFDILSTSNFRHIQPPVLIDDSNETLGNDNTALHLSYHGTHQLGEIYAAAGYISQELVYNESDVSRTDQLTTFFNVDKTIGPKSAFRYGANWTRHFTRVDNYSSKLFEDRYDAFTSFNYAVKPLWLISVSARQSWYAGKHAPFSPSLGTTYTLNPSGKSSVIIRAQASRGYRVPTLNDRYWNPGGNQNLKPENAWHVEGGVGWKHRHARRNLSADVSFYNTRSDQWIIWLPTGAGYWAPLNLQKVNVYGVENSLQSHWKTDRLRFHHKLSYSYTRSKNMRGLSEADDASAGKQLPYVPYHTAHFFTSASVKDWKGEATVDFTGLRHTTLDNVDYQALEPYMLVNGVLVRKFSYRHWSAIVRGTVYNVFGIYYENLKNRAMPGRNFSVSLTINFNHLKQNN